eukprot:13244942-Alexandrium_andersonii.AAC.1
MADVAASKPWAAQTVGLVAYQYTHPASKATVLGQWLAGSDAASQPAGGGFDLTAACNIARVETGSRPGRTGL